MIYLLKDKFLPPWKPWWWNKLSV